MNRKTLLALLVAVLVLPTAALAAHHKKKGTSGPKVTLEIKSLTKTLLRPTAVHGKKGWITKGGTPSGACPGESGAGALDVATHGRWKGTYYPKYKDILVSSILGVTPKRPDFWELLVNGKMSSVGICAVKLHAGEKIEFKIAK